MPFSQCHLLFLYGCERSSLNVSKKIFFCFFVGFDLEKGIMNVSGEDQHSLLHKCPQNQFFCFRSAHLNFGIMYPWQILDATLV